MDLNKINLSAIAAIGHDEENLGLLVQRGEELEYVEIPAPIEAYEGLEELAEIIGPEESEAEPNYSYNYEGEYYQKAEELEITRNNGLIYEYQRNIEVKVSETLSVAPDPDFTPGVPYNQESYYYEEETVFYREFPEDEQANLAQYQYQPESQSLRLEFDDGSIYEYEDVDPELWTEFQSQLPDMIDWELQM